MRVVISDENLGAPAELTRPARLNWMFANTDADIAILLERGCVPAPDAIARLVDALQRPGVGLAGPSTNRAWNEQRVCAGDDVAALAAEVEQRFGSECRTLAPLYSLADFCYAVRREVFDAIGPADEGYGAGPCWEMDYNIRAARAGFEGLWVCGAFVWRPAQTAEASAEELAHFAASKRRYQDKFCGARLRGVKHDHRDHCRGDDCPNFAPEEELPLVSCVMATCDRRPFIPLALHGYRAQTYAHRELLVLDDGHDPIEDLIPRAPDIRYIRVPPRASLGVKRNLGIAAARGRIVILWDDDDWYAATRIERQVAPILSGEADITGLFNRFLLQLPERKCWTVSAELHEMMYACDLPGGTMAFPRSLWQNGLQFPDYSLAEDAAFLREAVKMGKKVVRIDDGPQFIYVRHGANTWGFETGNFLHAAGWTEAEPPPDFSKESLDAYAAAAAAHAISVRT